MLTPMLLTVVTRFSEQVKKNITKSTGETLHRMKMHYSGTSVLPVVGVGRIGVVGPWGASDNFISN
jgi:hypothetical protein